MNNKTGILKIEVYSIRSPNVFCLESEIINKLNYQMLLSEQN